MILYRLTFLPDYKQFEYFVLGVLSRLMIGTFHKIQSYKGIVMDNQIKDIFLYF